MLTSAAEEDLAADRYIMFRLNCGFEPQLHAGRPSLPPSADTLLIASRFTIQICQTRTGRRVPRQRAHIPNTLGRAADASRRNMTHCAVVIRTRAAALNRTDSFSKTDEGRGQKKRLDESAIHLRAGIATNIVLRVRYPGKREQCETVSH